MKRNRVLLMVVIVLVTASTLFVLFVFGTRHARLPNGFDRRFALKDPLMASDTMGLGFDSYYFAGHSNHSLYLGNLTAPRHLLSVDLHTLDTQHVVVEIENREMLKYFALTTRVDSPYFFLTDGSLPAIFKGHLTDRMARRIEEEVPFFLKIEPMGPASFFLRSVDVERQARLGRVTLAPVSVQFRPELLTRQIDGIFCTDGMMHYDRASGRALYVYFYRNQYLLMDSMLNLLSRGNTIDTITVAKLDVSTILSEQTQTLSSPPSVVNRRSAVYNELLFINSSLRADNEGISDFRTSSVIDVYVPEENRYVGSFYLPHLNGSKLKNFCVADKRVIALYEKDLLFFDFDTGILLPASLVSE